MFRITVIAVMIKSADCIEYVFLKTCKNIFRPEKFQTHVLFNINSLDYFTILHTELQYEERW